MKFCISSDMGWRAVRRSVEGKKMVRGAVKNYLSDYSSGRLEG